MSKRLKRIVQAAVTNTGTVRKLKKQTGVFRVEGAQGDREI